MASRSHRSVQMPRAVLIVIAVTLSASGAEPTLLIEAARKGETAAIRDLIRNTKEINAAEADGATALHWVSYHDDGEAAAALIRAGANVNAANDLGVTPLWNACLNGST